MPSKRNRSQGTRLDPFTADIIRSYFSSTMQEMVHTTTRTAYSTCFSEGEDFTCGLFDANGRMIAQAYGIPMHAGALADAVAAIMAAYDSFHEGDVVLFNDPYHGGNHQADVVVARPMFVNHKFLGLAVNRGHWSDVGGMSPGGWSGTVTDVIQEGLIIPPVKLYQGGRLNREIREFILKNLRLPKQCWGDLQAQIASNIVAERRVRALANKYGVASVEEGMIETLAYSRRRFAKMLKRLPDGEFHGSETQEDDGHGGGPYRINVTIRKTGDRIVVDLTGTDRQVMGPVNCSFAGAKAGCYVPIIAVVDPHVPMNSGVLDLIEVQAPEGCMLRPVYPAPVFSWADGCIKTSEAVLKALAQMAPDRVAAGTFGTGNNVTGSGADSGDGDEFLWYVFEPGGCGARLTKDGNNVDREVVGNAKNESMEVWEARYPVRFERYEMVADSGGAGRHRGGLGARRQIRVLAPTRINGCADRRTTAPWGLFGGRDGLTNRFAVIRDGAEWELRELFGTMSNSKFSLVPLSVGDVLEIRSGGGGGYGDAFERDPNLVERDVLNGYVSHESAKRDYGVWIDRGSEKTDPAKTTSLRRRLRALHGKIPISDQTDGVAAAGKQPDPSRSRSNWPRKTGAPEVGNFANRKEVLRAGR